MSTRKQASKISTFYVSDPLTDTLSLLLGPSVISAEILRTIGPDNKDLSRLVCPFTTRIGQECDLGIASISIAGSIVVVHRKVDHTCDGNASDKAIRDANDSMLQEFDRVLDNVTKSNGEEKDEPEKRASTRLRRARKVVEEGRGTKRGEKEEEKRESRSMEEYEELLARSGDDHTKEKRKKQLESKDVVFPRALALQDTIDQLKTVGLTSSFLPLDACCLSDHTLTSIRCSLYRLSYNFLRPTILSRLKKKSSLDFTLSLNNVTFSFVPFSVSLPPVASL